MTLTTPLGSGPEFDRIRHIASVLGPAAGSLGDDCALIQIGGETLALSVDVSVEDVHFRTAWLSFEEIGWRAAAGALSDLAAEGASPIGLLAAVTVPAAGGEADVAAIMAGVGAAVASSGGLVLGGDLSSGPSWAVSITVIGRTPSPVTRAGAQPGDRLWVTGALGGARAALECWRHGKIPDGAAREAFAHPTPRIAAGQWLARHGAHAMLDLSDGLAGDVKHLAAGSGVGLVVDLDQVPVAPAAAAMAAQLMIEPTRFAAEGGEDYELLVALPPEFGEQDMERFVRECHLPLTAIGRLEVGAGARFLHAGQAVSLDGFDHFR